ncbi:MAG: NAD-binding protein [Candidatus Pacebacteria bacterium]|nr:NAD-binding protein [Candidatus Paceibacterota bacterium]
MSSSQVGILKRIMKGVSRLSWLGIIATLVLFFLGSWCVMAVAEPDKAISETTNFWWYFIVTIFTVGYGDLFPVTTLGRIDGAIIMLGGIGLASVIAAKLIDKIISLLGRRRKGLATVNTENHVIILGYRSGETERLVREIRADEAYKKTDIVLCAPVGLLSENPFQPKDGVEFVSGSLTDPEALKRASISKASRVIVYASDDDQTFSAALSAEDLVPESAHVVAFFSDPEKVHLLRRVAPGVECISPLAVELLVQSIQDPGSSAFVQDLVGNGGSFNQYRTDLSDGFDTQNFSDFASRLKRENDALLIGVAESHNPSSPILANPSSDTLIRSGMSIIYLSGRRLPFEELMRTSLQ